MGKRKAAVDLTDAAAMAAYPEVQGEVKLTIAIAAGGDFVDQMAISLVLAVKALLCPIRLDMEKSCYVHKNRNRLLARAMASDSTHLMFIDTDIQFPADGIRRLIAHRLPLVGGAYNLRQPPKDGQAVTTVKALGDHDQVQGQLLDRSKPFECRALPTGFMLIDLNMMRGLTPPPLSGGRNDRDEDKGEPLWFDFGNYDGFVGEDVFFCDRVREQGVPIWCDPTIPLGHIGTAVY